MLSLVKVSSNRAVDTLLEVMTIDDIPDSVGGNFRYEEESFQFNLSENGPLWYPGFQPPFTGFSDVISESEASSESASPIVQLRKVSFSYDIPRPAYIRESSPRKLSSASSQPEIIPPVDHVTALLDYFKSKSLLFDMPTIPSQTWDEARATLTIENAQAKATESINEVLDYIQTQNDTFFQQQPSHRRLSVSSIMESAQATLQSESAVKIADYFQNPTLPFGINDSSGEGNALSKPINEVFDYIQTQNEAFFQASSRHLSVSSVIESAQATLGSDPTSKLVDYWQNPILSFQPGDLDRNLESSFKYPLVQAPPIDGIFNIFNVPSSGETSRVSRDDSPTPTPDESDNANQRPDLLKFLKKQDESFREFSSSHAESLKKWVDSLSDPPSSSTISEHPIYLYLQSENAKLLDLVSSSPVFSQGNIIGDVIPQNNMTGEELIDYLKAHNQQLLTSLIEKVDPTVATEVMTYFKNQNQHLQQILSSLNASSTAVSTLDGQKKIEELMQYFRTQQDTFEEKVKSFLTATK